MATAIEEKYLTPAQVCELVPGMTKTNLSQLRYVGKGPKYLKPTPRVVVYRERDIIAWLEGSERTGTADNAR